VSGSTGDPGLVLVFELEGIVYAYTSAADAGQSIESIDVGDARYLGAFSHRGEVIAMGTDDLYATFTPTGRFAQARLALS